MERSKEENLLFHMPGLFYNLSSPAKIIMHYTQLIITAQHKDRDKLFYYNVYNSYLYCNVT